ncbi:sodium-dependent transporter [Pontibaca methylaminivorans]|uniref:sodium-dependent transporter n=1 Tax=Pontibaca methylaminivorans TaxID=515897 RepID=UPI002FD911AE
MIRERWGSQFGFIMSAAGLAIGLGNIWRFPYLVGSNGGGVFVLVYLIIVALICMPLLTMELSLGRKAGSNPVGGMRALTRKGSPWVLFGWSSVLAAFLILTFYIQVMGWILIYLVKMPLGLLDGLDHAELMTSFETTVGNGWLIAGTTLICTVLVAAISIRGLERGIEKASKIFMPLLFAMLIILAIRSLTLPGSMTGLKWYLGVDFSALDGKVILAALGQGFFSMSIAAGGSFIFGSYLRGKSNIPRDAAIIIALDTMVALLAGLVIFPAIFSIGLAPASGPSLLFVSMSGLFGQIPAGAVFGTMFFLLLFIAAITSAIGCLEPVVATCADLMGTSRARAVTFSLTAIFVAGIPNILAHGAWSQILIAGRNLFEFTDYLSGNILMTFGALMLALYTVLVWTFSRFRDETNVGAAGPIRVYNWWFPLLAFLLPTAILLILITGLV